MGRPPTGPASVRGNKDRGGCTRGDRGRNEKSSNQLHKGSGPVSSSADRGPHEAVLDRVGRSIVAGEHEPGTPLDLAAVGDELGVSRSVVREALRVLDTLGMVRAWPKRGTFVRPRSDWNWLHPLVLSWSHDQHGDVEFLQAVAQMREIVEPNVAAIAAAHRTEAEAMELRAALGAMEGADGDIERFIDADVLFHRVLLRATHNELLAQIGGVIDSAIRSHDRGVSAQHWAESLALHLQVADAVARRSPADAEGAMRKVLEQALSDVKGTGELAPPANGKRPSLIIKPPARARRDRRPA